MNASSFLILLILIFSSFLYFFYFFTSEDFSKFLEREKISLITNKDDYTIYSNFYKYTEWFSLYSSLKNDYIVKINSDKNIVEIVKKNKDIHLKELELYAIYFKRSSAYDIGVSVLLESFKKLFNIKMTIYYVDYDEDLTLKILDDINEKNKKTIVLSVGSDTTDFLYPISENYKNLIFVSITSKDPKSMGYVSDINMSTGKNFVLTSLNLLPELQFQYIKAFFTNLKKVIILVDSDNKSSINTQYLPLEEIFEKNGIKVYPVLVKANQKNPKDINNKFEKELLNVKEKITEDGFNKDDTLIIMTGSTILFERYFIVNKIFPELLICSMMPDQTIGKYENTASFGIGVTFQKNAFLVVEYILKILLGKKPENMPIGYIYPPDISINVTHFQKKGFTIPEQLILVATLVYSE